MLKKPAGQHAWRSASIRAYAQESQPQQTSNMDGPQPGDGLSLSRKQSRAGSPPRTSETPPTYSVPLTCSRGSGSPFGPITAVTSPPHRDCTLSVRRPTVAPAEQHAALRSHSPASYTCTQLPPS
jgi:hypothetical protein